MAIILTDCSTYFDEIDVTTHSNQLELGVEADVQDATCFRPAGAPGGPRWRAKEAGLVDGSASLSGLWDASVEDALRERLGGLAAVVTQTPRETEGDIAYMYRAQLDTLNMLGAVGDLNPFDLSMTTKGREGVVRGRLASKTRTVSATGVVGSPVEAGAASATAFVYAAIHVWTAGTTLTLRLESDTTSGFASPTTVATLPAITAAGGVWMTRVPGPATDTWYRLNATAVTGSFSLAAAIGVG